MSFLSSHLDGLGALGPERKRRLLRALARLENREERIRGRLWGRPASPGSPGWNPAAPTTTITGSIGVSHPTYPPPGMAGLDGAKHKGPAIVNMTHAQAQMALNLLKQRQGGAVPTKAQSRRTRRLLARIDATTPAGTPTGNGSGGGGGGGGGGNGTTTQDTTHGITQDTGAGSGGGGGGGGGGGIVDERAGTAWDTSGAWDTGPSSLVPSTDGSGGGTPTDAGGGGSGGGGGSKVPLVLGGLVVLYLVTRGGRRKRRRR